MIELDVLLLIVVVQEISQFHRTVIAGKHSTLPPMLPHEVEQRVVSLIDDGFDQLLAFPTGLLPVDIEFREILIFPVAFCFNEPR